MAELPLPAAPQPKRRQKFTSAGRRAKITRGVGATARIVRLTVMRPDDDGTLFRSSISLDGSVFALAAQLWGGEEIARARLVQLAETFWVVDQRARRGAEDSGGRYEASRSVSRHIQREVIVAATERLAALGRQATLGLPVLVPAKDKS